MTISHAMINMCYANWMNNANLSLLSRDNYIDLVIQLGNHHKVEWKKCSMLFNYIFILITYHSKVFLLNVLLEFYSTTV